MVPCKSLARAARAAPVCVLDRAGRLRFRLRSTEIDRVSRGSAPLAQPTVEAETPRGPHKQNDESAHD
jgi:hypothetical protein